LETVEANSLTTSGTHKPSWRKTIPEDWKKGVTKSEYWEHSRFCAKLIVEQAGFDVVKLASLVDNYHHSQQTSNIISPEYTGIFLIKQLIKG
jgi:hypothetical protein